MPTRSGRRYTPYGRSTRSNTIIPPSNNRRRATNNRPCNDCPPAAAAPDPEPVGRMYGENDNCKRHRKPDNSPKNTVVRSYRRR